MALTSQITASLYTSISHIRSINSIVGGGGGRSTPRVSYRLGSTFASGTPLLTQSLSLQRKQVSRGTSISIRCEQNANEGTGLDVWLGRVAMVGFAAAISVEIGTGKGLLENFGLTSPLPTVALGVTALVGVLTAIFIFQSASDK